MHAHTHTHTHRFLSTLRVPVAFFYLVTSPLPLPINLLYCFLSWKILSQRSCFQCLSLICTLSLFSCFLIHVQYMYSTLYKPCTGSTTHPQMHYFFITLPTSWFWLHVCKVVKLSSFWWPCISVLLGGFCESHRSWTHCRQCCVYITWGLYPVSIALCGLLPYIKCIITYVYTLPSSCCSSAMFAQCWQARSYSVMCCCARSWWWFTAHTRGPDRLKQCKF